MHLGTFTPPCISTTLFGVVTRSRLRLVTLQVSKADEWHGARRMARADTQQTQQKQKQKQQKQQKQKQPTDGSQTRVPSFTSDPAGAVGVEARLPAIAYTTSRSLLQIPQLAGYLPCSSTLSFVCRTHLWPSQLTNDGGSGGGARSVRRRRNPRRRRKDACWRKRRPRLRQPSPLRQRRS